MRIIHLASLALSAYVASAQNYGTGKFYINNLLNPHLCVRDCEPGGPLNSPNSICGGIVTESWITLHQTVDDCCNYQLRWMDLAVCKDKANPNIDGTTKWWAGEKTYDSYFLAHSILTVRCLLFSCKTMMTALATAIAIPAPPRIASACPHLSSSTTRPRFAAAFLFPVRILRYVSFLEKSLAYLSGSSILTDFLFQLSVLQFPCCGHYFWRLVD